jgi:GNAT superfamily N-acetyltransferase
MSEITIRPAGLPDLEDLVPLFDGYRQFYGRGSDPDAAREFLRARFNQSDSTVLIAHDQGVPIGFTQLYPSFSSVSLARVFILNDLFVQASSRQQGVGSALIAAAVAFARSAGAIRLSLSTATTNTPAQSLYTALGWQRDQQFYVYHFAIA